MIINKKLKFIFIGLPYSGSSTISKELIKNYNCKTLFHKHANIPLLLREQPKINISDYFIFAVQRDPIDITFSMYNKFLTNAHNVFTDPKYFIENGGFVSKKARKTFLKVHKYNWSFEDYIKNIYRFKQYNNDLSINNKYINYIISFKDMSTDFNKCLKKIGLKPKRELPVYNKTEILSANRHLTQSIANKVFDSFYMYNKRFFTDIDHLQQNTTSQITFRIFHYFRLYKRLRYDIKQKSNLQSYD